MDIAHLIFIETIKNILLSEYNYDYEEYIVDIWAEELKKERKNIKPRYKQLTLWD